MFEDRECDIPPERLDRHASWLEAIAGRFAETPGRGTHLMRLADERKNESPLAALRPAGWGGAVRRAANQVGGGGKTFSK